MEAMKRLHGLAASGVIGLVTVMRAGSVILPTAAVAEYSWQVSGSYEDIDAAIDVESSRSSVRATWYLSPVDDEVGPYELAPFLNRSSYVTVGTARMKLREQHFFPAISRTGVVSDRMLADDGIHIMAFDGVIPGLGGYPAESGVDTYETAATYGPLPAGTPVPMRAGAMLMCCRICCSGKPRGITTVPAFSRADTSARARPWNWVSDPTP